MFRKKIITLAMIAATLAAPAQRAAADAGDAILGAIVGGVITGIVVNEANKNKPPKRNVVVVRPDSPQRIANRQTQTALNYFSFNAGYADGVFGPKTATAVRNFQAFLGFPQTGKLAAVEHDILMAAYNRGQVGDYGTLQLINSSPMGVRALLTEQRDIAFGRPGDAGTTVSTPVTATMDVDTNDAAPAPMGLPLIPVPTGQGNLANFCSNATITGPRITLAAMTDPVPALNQVFCGARAEAIETSDSLAAAVPGVTQADIEAQCAQLGPVMQPYVATLNTKGRAAVISDVNGFVASSGTDRTQLASTAQICLGTGYSMDDMNVALGSALLLTALGESAYGELMGHHLYQGFGVAANSDRALEWLVWTTDELAAGATPVFGSSDGSRMELVDEVVYRLNGGAPSSAAKNTSSKGKLPMVDVKN